MKQQLSDRRSADPYRRAGPDSAPGDIEKGLIGLWPRTAWFIRASLFVMLVCLSFVLCVPRPSVAQGSIPTKGAEEFDRGVAGLLARRCLACHSGAEPQGGLDLSSTETATKGGDSGVVIIPGDPDKSSLVRRILNDEMPPKEPLDAGEKEQLVKWIKEGAAWGTSPIDPFRFSTQHRAGFDWWSLQGVQRHSPPAVQSSSWCKNEIDYFILSKLDQAGLAPSKPAEPRVLVRRLYFDLIGLPPPPEVVKSFAANPTEQAYQELVERLLASPQFGERWARHWLDVVRFGESDGFERNNPRPNAWHYRDWVIQALNQDLPYDEFASQQIAGDVLSDAREGIKATGYLVAGVHNTVVPVLEIAQKAAREDELEDMVSSLGQTFLGLTIQCARCHEHKFDPVSQKDYYRLVASLRGVEHGERPVYSTLQELGRKATEAALQAEIVAIRRQISDIEDRARARVLAPRNGDQNEQSLVVQPIGQWLFNDEGKDEIGTLHAELREGARVDHGRLKLGMDKAHAKTGVILNDLHEKTLEAWTTLSFLEQRGGAVMAVEALSHHAFDAIVYGEREAKKWMAGSNFFVRTKDVDGPLEDVTPVQLIHVAISYSADGTIAIYRNGQPYAPSYVPAGPDAGLHHFAGGDAFLLFGARHTTATNGVLHGEIEEARLYDRALTAAEVAESFAKGTGIVGISREKMLAALTDQERSQRDSLLAQLEVNNKKLNEIPPLPRAYAVNTSAPAPTFLLKRGDVRLPQEEITSGPVTAVKGDAPIELPKDADDAARRKELARWITRADNPLFTRVIVNRIWHHHFGIGIVETPSDFGFNGGRPSHPELLDFLAAKLVDEKFRMKALHRLIVTSAAYRQVNTLNPAAQQVDANNRLLWRRTPLRMEAETLRDSMLHVAGLLNLAAGGPGFHDVRDYYNSGTTYYEPVDVDGPEFFRRAIYRFSPRGERSPLLDTFDCPDPSVATPRRQVTTTPLQALSLLNNSFALTVAARFAERVAKDANEMGDSSTTRQVQRAFALAYGRTPTDAEAALALRLIESHGLKALCRAILNSNEFIFVE